MRAWTSFGVGTSAAAAVAAAAAGSNPPPVDAGAAFVEVGVPDGVDAAKLGTHAQRALSDGEAAEVPPAAAGVVDEVVGHLRAGTCVALPMGDGPVAQKMLARLGTGADGERAYLLLGPRAD